MTYDIEERKNKGGKRVPYVDCAKGIAIILVVFGHTVEWICPNQLGDMLHNVIYSFHMPLFFVLSGLTYSDEKNKYFKPFIIKKIKTLVVPSYVFVIIMLFLEYIFGLYNFSFSIRVFVKTVLQFRMDSFRNYWFLPTLFWAFVILWCVHKIFKKDNHRLGILIIVSIIGAIYITYVRKPLPFSFDNALLLAVFIEIGCQLKLILEKIKKIQLKYVILVLSLWIIFLVLNSYVIGEGAIYLAQSNIQNPVLFYLEAIFGSLFCIFICFNSNKVKMIIELGKHTLIIYILQGTIVWNVSKYINKYHCANVLVSVVMWITVTAFTVLISYGISLFINKKMPFLIGKRKQNEVNVKSQKEK